MPKISIVKGENRKEKNKKKLVDNARGYANLIREHIFKEDNILYPMADKTIDEKTEKIMLEKFKRIGKENKEKENHEKFAKNLK